MTIQHALVFVALFLILVALTAYRCNAVADVIKNNSVWRG